MQYGDEKKEKLNRLERKLYSRNTPNIIGESETKINPLNNQEEVEIPKEDWQDTKVSSFDELASKVSGLAREKHSFINKFFGFSVLFFAIACGVAIFIFWGGGNQVSSKNVDIKIVGPISVGAGQEVSFDINIINNNNIDLESASLLIKYPSGTRSGNDLTKELDQERFVLDKIKSAESYSQNIKAAFFGEKDDLKQLNISLEYRVANSSALFYKEKTHEVSISSAPIIVTPTYPKEVNSNQEISFSVEIASNSKDKINNFLVNAEYPFGFVFKEAVPNTSFGNNVWRFTNLNPGEKRTIVIKGTVVGQNNEEKVFKINTGIASEKDERTIAIPFSQLVESVLIKKSFIGLEVVVGGEEGNFISQNNNQVSTQLVVRNNLPSALFNVSTEVILKGGAFSQSGVFAEKGGFFQSFNNTILWDSRAVPGFSNMMSGAEERMSFRLAPLSYSDIASGAKPEIEITVKVKGERISESGSTENISSIETRKIILATNLSLSSRSVRSVGNIENSGPIPPKVNVPTTYTVVWSISNSFNQASNVEAKAILPPYVKWTNITSPISELLSFNQSTNEIVWNVGSVLPNTGYGNSKKEVYFQLEFLPSTSQIGATPIILGETLLVGTDKVTGLKMKFNAPAVSINFAGDPSFKTGDDKVTQ